LRKTFLVVVIIAIIAIAAIAIVTFYLQSKRAPRYCIINYEGSWNGTIIYDGESHNFGGIGIKAVRLPTNVKTVTVTIQKRDSLTQQIELLLVADLNENDLTWDSSDVIVSNAGDNSVTVKWKS